MTLKVSPFLNIRLWSDDREDLISIIDDVSSTGGFILQKAVSNFGQLAQYARTNYSVGLEMHGGMEIFLKQ